MRINITLGIAVMLAVVLLVVKNSGAAVRTTEEWRITDDWKATEDWRTTEYTKAGQTSLEACLVMVLSAVAYQLLK